MKHEVLQVAIGRADWTAEPGRNKDAHRSQTIGMNIKESENFRLRESNGVQDCAGLESAIFAEFDHRLHAKRPFARSMTLRHSDVRVNLAAYCSDWTV